MSWLEKIDIGLFFAVIIIFLFGCLGLYSIQKQLLISQILFFIFSLIFFFIFFNLGIEIFSPLKYHLYFFSLFFLFLTPFVGQITRGAVRWIKIGPFSLQISELVKPILVLSFASLSENYNLKKLKHLLKFFILFIIPFLMIFKQPDLGNALVVFISWLVIVFFSNVSFKNLSLFILFIFLSFPVVWHFLKPFQQQRLISFLNPKLDPLNSGYNSLQAQIALGSGGFLGKGLGKGNQSQLRFLPERHSDFIFSSLGEELGFFGSFLLILTYFFLLYKLFRISFYCLKNYSQKVCYSLSSIIFFQSFVNIGMNMGILPITGITLPLVSYGGSSLLSTLIMIGLISSPKNSLKKDLIEIR